MTEQRIYFIGVEYRSQSSPCIGSLLGSFAVQSPHLGARRCLDSWPRSQFYPAHASMYVLRTERAKSATSMRA
jgi:hypothetical protein